MRVIALLLGLAIIAAASARDLNGTYADSPLHDWFDSLSSGKGMCCSFADGRTVEDPDWGADSKGYWVIVDGKRYSVPKDALVTVPNKFGRAVVWPYVENGVTKIRCFLPGAGA